MKILVLSCDKNGDLFDAFHHCMEKYYPNHPEIIYATETIQNPYYKNRQQTFTDLKEFLTARKAFPVYFEN